MPGRAAFCVDERAIVPRSLIAEPLANGVLDAWLGARSYPSNRRPATLVNTVGKLIGSVSGKSRL